MAGTIFSGCSDQDDASPAVPACLPTTIPAEIGDDDYLQVSYNASGKPAKVSYPDDPQQAHDISYDEQNRLVAIGTEADEFYYTFEYTNDEIKETGYYEKGGSYTFDDFTIYKTDEQGRIVTRTHYELEDGGTEKGTTEEYVYDERGNIIKVIDTDSEGEIDITLMTYDDKVNPFRTLGFMIDYGGLFNFITLSQNNLVSYQSGEDDTTPDRISYEYDEMGNPVKLVYEARYRSQEYDSEGNKVGEPKEVVETYENSIVFTCQ